MSENKQIFPKNSPEIFYILQLFYILRLNTINVLLICKLQNIYLFNDKYFTRDEINRDYFSKILAEKLFVTTNFL